MSIVLIIREGPEHNARGFLVIGPQCISPSDVLAKLIADAQGTLDETHFAPSPDAQRKQLVTYRGEAAKRRRYPTHGPTEFLRAIA